jgi:hypothetical protein
MGMATLPAILETLELALTGMIMCPSGPSANHVANLLPTEPTPASKTMPCNKKSKQPIDRLPENKHRESDVKGGSKDGSGSRRSLRYPSFSPAPIPWITIRTTKQIIRS